MLKKGLFLTLMTVALTMVWGCGSSDDDDDDIQPPVPGKETTWTKESQVFPLKIDWSGNESQPEWADFSKVPDNTLYENWMIVMVTLEDELAAYASENDFMGVFIGNSMRALANPAIKIGNTKDVSFILKVVGDEEADKTVGVTIKYYCANLRQTFTLEGNEMFVPEKVYGVNEMFIVPLLGGCAKYPISTDIKIIFPAEKPSFIEPAIEDKLVVIVDGECRGVGVLEENLFSGPSKIYAFGKTDGEEGRIYFYDASENTFWNTGKTVVLSDGIKTVNLTY